VKWEDNGKTGKGTGKEKGREERNLKGTVMELKRRKKVGHRNNIGITPRFIAKCYRVGPLQSRPYTRIDAYK